MSSRSRSRSLAGFALFTGLLLVAGTGRAAPVTLGVNARITSAHGSLGLSLVGSPVLLTFTLADTADEFPADPNTGYYTATNVHIVTNAGVVDLSYGLLTIQPKAYDGPSSPYPTTSFFGIDAGDIAYGGGLRIWQDAPPLASDALPDVALLNTGRSSNLISDIYVFIDPLDAVSAQQLGPVFVVPEPGLSLLAGVAALGGLVGSARRLGRRDRSGGAAPRSGATVRPTDATL